MTSIKVFVEGSTISATLDGKLTSGMVGVPVEIEYDQDWENLSKICIFRVGSFSRQRERVDKTTTVPWEVLRNFGKTLEVGVQGKTEDGEIVIPTVWATVGFIHEGANATIPGAPAPGQGEQPSGNDLIDDGIVSSQSTWSSEKINLELDDRIESYINDEDEDPFSLWSSVKVKNYTDNKVAALIDDASIDPDGTWSSEKISEAISEAAGGSASKQYELIEEITLPEATAIIKRNKYPEGHPQSGEPYNFSAIRAYVSIPDKCSVTAQIIFCTGTASNSFYIYHAQKNGLQEGKASQAFFRVYNDGGFVNYEVAVSQNYTKHAIPVYIAKVWENVNRLEISSNNSGDVFPADTKIRIWGIRG